MLCKSCNKHYTSKLSFVTESICQSCFNKMSDQEKMQLLDAKDGEKTEKAAEVNLKGKKIKCPVCNNSHFWKHQVSSSAPEASLFGFDSINHHLETYTCDSCGYLMWFIRTK